MVHAFGGGPAVPSPVRKFPRRRFLISTAALLGAGAMADQQIRVRVMRRLQHVVWPPEKTPLFIGPAPVAGPVLHFIAGFESSKKELTKLAEGVDRVYREHIPGIRIAFYHEFDDVFEKITAAAPTGPLVIAGFSYGGSTAVDAAIEFHTVGRPVDHLILLDPVQRKTYSRRPNTVDFILPSNVVEAVCYHRDARSSPFSTPIRGTPATRYRNYVCGKNHGDQIWHDEPMAKIAMAMRGQPMVPTAPIV